MKPKKKVKEKKTCKGCGFQTDILTPEGLCYDCIEGGVTEAKKAGQALVNAEDALKDAISQLEKIVVVPKEGETTVEQAWEWRGYEDDEEEEEPEEQINIQEQLAQLHRRIKDLETKPPVAIKPKKEGKKVPVRRRLLRPIGVKKR